MTNTVLLRRAVKNRGIKYQHIAQELGISPTTLSRKVQNDSDFRANEIAAITKILDLSPQEVKNIFLQQS